jgi:hypothetical protein
MLSLAARPLTGLTAAARSSTFSKRVQCARAFHSALRTSHHDLNRITTSHHIPTSIDDDTRLRIQWQQSATFT